MPNLIDRPGTPEDAWDSWLDLRHLPVADPGAWRSAVVVAAHPDDEVLGAGGTMALLAAAGARLRLIAVTDGEASHPGADPQVTALTRIAETADALQALGVGGIEVIRLRFPDAGLAAREAELAAVLAEQCAGFEVCLAPWEADAHADHEAAGRAARRAARQAGRDVLAYPIWMWHWAKPADQRVPWQRACRIPLPAEVAARKRAAIGAFASQLLDRGRYLGPARGRRPSGPARAAGAGVTASNHNGSLPDANLSAEHREGAAGPVLSPGVVAHFTRPQEVLLR